MSETIGRTVHYLRASLDRVHAFRGPRGPLPCTLQRATVYHDHRTIAGFELDARFEAGDFAQVLEHGAFELTPTHRGESFGGELTADAPVDVTLFLRPETLRDWFPSATTAADDAIRLIEAISGDDVINAAENWVFLSVTQPVPGHAFSAGYRHASHPGIDSHLVFDPAPT